MAKETSKAALAKETSKAALAKGTSKAALAKEISKASLAKGTYRTVLVKGTSKAALAKGISQGLLYERTLNFYWTVGKTFSYLSLFYFEGFPKAKNNEKKFGGIIREMERIAKDRGWNIDPKEDKPQSKPKPKKGLKKHPKAPEEPEE